MTPIILITIEGGAVAGIVSDQPVEVHIIDKDCVKAGVPSHHESFVNFNNAPSIRGQISKARAEDNWIEELK